VGEGVEGRECEGGELAPALLAGASSRRVSIFFTPEAASAPQVIDLKGKLLYGPVRAYPLGRKSAEAGCDVVHTTPPVFDRRLKDTSP
jgi:hypothetical protein